MTKDHIDKLSELNLKGRFESYNYNENEIIFNGSHNIDGMRKCRDLWQVNNVAVSSELKGTAYNLILG